MWSALFSTQGSIRRPWRVGLILVAVMTAVVASLAATAAGADSKKGVPAVGVSDCPTSGLVIWLRSEGGATGHFLFNIEFTNESGHSCSLKGYPKVSAVALSGRTIGSAATTDTSIKPSRVTLGTSPAKPSATARAPLSITNVAFFTPSACRPVWAAGLSIKPPGQTSAKFVPLVFQACSKKGNFIYVLPVQKS